MFSQRFGEVTDKDSILYEFRLFDLTGISFDLLSEEIKEIAEYGKRKFTKKNRAAYVAPSDLAFGEMRMFSVFREQDIAEIRTFRNKEEATEWLKSSK